MSKNLFDNLFRTRKEAHQVGQERNSSRGTYDCGKRLYRREERHSREFNAKFVFFLFFLFFFFFVFFFVLFCFVLFCFDLKLIFFFCFLFFVFKKKKQDRSSCQPS